MRGYHTVTHRFQEVTRSDRVSVKCAGCGKDRVRTVTVTHTINPYNRNDDGSVRSPQEVADRVRAELAGRVKETAASTIICKTCLATSDAASILARKAEGRVAGEEQGRVIAHANTPIELKE